MRIWPGLIACLCVASGTARAQERPFGDVYAIVGARIEVGNGRVIEKGTVLLRDGLIEAVGTEVPLSPDAEVIQGDGLVVFPGFIDAFTSKGLNLPDAEPNQDVTPDTRADAPPF